MQLLILKIVNNPSGHERGVGVDDFDLFLTIYNKLYLCIPNVKTRYMHDIYLFKKKFNYNTYQQ